MSNPTIPRHDVGADGLLRRDTGPEGPGPDSGTDSEGIMSKTLLAITLLATTLPMTAGCAEAENQDREVQIRVAATPTDAN